MGNHDISKLWDVAIAFDGWARTYPEDAVEAILQALPEDDINSDSVPARVLRLFVFHESLIGQNESRAKRVGLNPLGDVLGIGGVGYSLSHEITQAIYAKELEAHRQDFSEIGQSGPSLDWRHVRKHFESDAEDRETEKGNPAGQRARGGEGVDQGGDGGTPKRTRDGKVTAGRKPISAHEESKRRHILEKWEHAKAQGVSRANFCSDDGITVTDLKRCQEWQRQRDRASK